jgi:hypothetical protein
MRFRRTPIPASAKRIEKVLKVYDGLYNVQGLGAESGREVSAERDAALAMLIYEYVQGATTRRWRRIADSIDRAIAESPPRGDEWDDGLDWP